jgi:dTDP-4-dehydrorhamnose 3,5-epimerase
VVVVEPAVHGDARGFFLETLHVERYRDAGIVMGAQGAPVQLNHSRSVRNTLRGLHFQEPKPQGKLVWVVAGAVFDVAVDVRRGSPTYGRWTGTELSADGHRQMWIPPGFAHGFCVLSEVADCMYACSDYYAPECEQTILWSDPDVGVRWPVDKPILSAKDAGAPRLCEARMLPAYRG